MNKRWARKWVEALRDPLLRQTNGRLKDLGGECCLGTLCRITETPVVRLRTDGVVEFGAQDQEDDGAVSAVEPNYLPRWTKEITGMDSKSGNIVWHFEDVELNTSLAELNDSGLTPNQIADTIDFFWDWL